MISNEINQAQEVLCSVEKQCLKVGLGLNAKKTKYISFNTPDDISIKTNDGTELEKVKDFKYLGSWVTETEKDMKVRISLAWKALNSMNNIWKSKMSTKLKTRFFSATVESVLIYGCESWSMNATRDKKINGCYTRMLRDIKNINWSEHITNEELYGKLPKISEKIRKRRLKFAGHCMRHPELAASSLVLWQPSHGQASRGRALTNFVENLCKDTSLTREELPAVMKDREQWRAIVRSCAPT